MLSTDAIFGVERKKNTYSQGMAYKSIVWVYACVNAIANSISGCPIDVMDGTTVTGEKLFVPVNNDIPTQAELIKRIFVYLETAGGCFLLLVRKKQVVVGVELIPPTVIRPILAKNGIDLLGWGRYDLKSKRRIEVHSIKELLPLLYFDPDQAYVGLSPLKAARLSLEQHYSMMKWNAAYFKDGIRSDIIVKYKKRLKDEQRKDARKAIREYTHGTEQGHGVLLLDGSDYDVEKGPGAISVKDLDFIDGQQLTREDICSVFGVPPAMVGIFRYANYANTLEQRKIFWEQSANPRMSYLKDLLQTLYLDVHFPGRTMAWDITGVSALQLPQKEKAVISSLYIKSGKTWDEIASILSAPELAGETRTVTTDSSGQGGEEGEVPEATGEAHFTGIKAGNEEQIYSEYQQAVQTLLAPIERSWSSLVLSMIKQIGLMLDRKVQKGEPPQVMAGIWQDTWYQIAEPLVRRAMTLGEQTVAQEVKTKGVAVDTGKKFLSFRKESTPIGTLLTVHELEVFERQVSAYTSKTIDVSASIIEQMNRKAMEIYRAGGGIEKIRLALRELVKETYSGRHLTIARTINGGAYNGARQGAMHRAGTTKTRWITSGGAAVRKSHVYVNGTEVPFGEKFANGLRFPHDPYGTAKEIINCRCTTAITAIKKVDEYKPKPIPPENMDPIIMNGKKDSKNRSGDVEKHDALADEMSVSISFEVDGAFIDLEMTKSGITFHPQTDFGVEILGLFEAAYVNARSGEFEHNAPAFDSEAFIYSEMDEKRLELHKKFTTLLYKIVAMLDSQGVAVRTVPPNWLLNDTVDWPNL